MMTDKIPTELELDAGLAKLEREFQRLESKFKRQEMICRKLDNEAKTLRFQMEQHVYSDLPITTDRKVITVEMEERDCENRPQLERLRMLKARLSEFPKFDAFVTCNQELAAAQTLLGEIRRRLRTSERRLISLRTEARSRQVKQQTESQSQQSADLDDQVVRSIASDLVSAVERRQIIDQQGILRAIQDKTNSPPEVIFERARKLAQATLAMRRRPSGFE